MMDVKELVERLRAKAWQSSRPKQGKFESEHVCWEAADALEALAAERDKAMQTAARLASEAACHRIRAEKAEAALAEALAWWDRTRPATPTGTLPTWVARSYIIVRKAKEQP